MSRSADRLDERMEWLAGHGMSYSTTYKGYGMRLEAVESPEDPTDYLWQVEVDMPGYGWDVIHTGISGQTVDEVVATMREEIDHWDPVD